MRERWWEAGRARHDGVHRRIEDDAHVLLPHPQVLGARDGNDAGLRQRREAGIGLIWASGSRRIRERARSRACQSAPRSRGRRGLARRSGGDSSTAPSTSRSAPCISASSVPKLQPSSQRCGKPRSTANCTAARTSAPSPTPSSKRALRGASRRGGAARVEAEHRDVGQVRQPPRRLAQHVRVHEAAVGGQRVQGDERRRDASRGWQRELAHERQPVLRDDLDVLAVRGAAPSSRRSRPAQPRVLPKVCQHALCQCRRSWPAASAPKSPSAAHATMCSWLPGTS